MRTQKLYTVSSLSVIGFAAYTYNIFGCYGHFDNFVYFWIFSNSNNTTGGIANNVSRLLPARVVSKSFCMEKAVDVAI